MLASLFGMASLVPQKAVALEPVILITPEEAQLPSPKSLPRSRAITRGPRIDVSEFVTDRLHSPLRFRLRFHAYGHALLDLKSLHVTYLRGGNVDLTDRIAPFLKDDAVDIPDAIAPPGEHNIRVEIGDSEGRVASTNFVLSIAPN